MLRNELPPTPSGVITVVDEDGVPVIRLSGEIDAQVVAAYDREHGGDPAPDAPPAVIDVSGVTFLDCRGLGFLVRQSRAGRGGGAAAVLRRPSRVVRRVIDLAGARACFTISF